MIPMAAATTIQKIRLYNNAIGGALNATVLKIQEIMSAKGGPSDSDSPKKIQLVTASAGIKL